MARTIAPIKVFCCYAHEDELYLQELKTHLSGLQREGLISIWHDRKLVAGTDWSQAIETHLETASLILLLVSADFLASNFCYEVEMQRALGRHEAGQARVLPIIVRPCDWYQSPIARLQSLPLDGKPITIWDNQDLAWSDVTTGIRRVIEDLSFSSPVSQNQPAVLWPSAVPDEQYYALPGRETDLTRLLSVLQNPQGPLVVTIDGLGGLGKTAMAVELVRRLLQEKRFEGVVGESAKQELLAGGKIVQVSEATLDLEGLLDAIVSQMGHWELRTLKREEKYAMLRKLLQQTPYLVLVDNLETAQSADTLVFHLRSFLGTSRAIVTSRKQVRYTFVWSHSLRGLTHEDSLFFLQKEGEQHGLEQLKSVSEEKLVEIATVTGGAPLALKLVAAQTRFLDLDILLGRLHYAGSRLYSFIYRQSWQQLSPIAQRILIYIGQTVVTTVGWEELAMVGLEIAESEEQLLEAIDELVTYSLLEASCVGKRVRYRTHQLTRQFVNSELPQLWKEQGLL